MRETVSEPTFAQWWQKEGMLLFSDFIALRADPQDVAKQVWDAAHKSCQTEKPEWDELETEP